MRSIICSCTGPLVRTVSYFQHVSRQLRAASFAAAAAATAVRFTTRSSVRAKLPRTNSSLMRLVRWIRRRLAGVRMNYLSSTNRRTAMIELHQECRVWAHYWKLIVSIQFPQLSSNSRSVLSCLVLRSACLYVCLPVCLSLCLFVGMTGRIFQKSHVQVSSNYMYMLVMLPVAVSSGVNAIGYMLPV